MRLAMRRCMATTLMLIVFATVPKVELRAACPESDMSTGLVAQVSRSWCWAACLSVLYGEYGAVGYTQGFLAGSICRGFCPSPTSQPFEPIPTSNAANVTFATAVSIGATITTIRWQS